MHWIRGWVGPKGGLDVLETIKPLSTAVNRTSIPRSTSPNPGHYMARTITVPVMNQTHGLAFTFTCVYTFFF
jgi:hypothetical protein